MSRRQTINIPLEQTELEALVAAARLDLRHPRDQARYLLRSALGFSPGDEKPPPAPMTNGAGLTLASDPGAVSATSL